MSTARRDFLDRVTALRLATSSEVVFSKAPTEREHNARASLLRNGLAVVTFALLEHFIKSRTGEIMARVGSGTTPFADLPEGIKHAATSGVISALRFMEKYLDPLTQPLIPFHQLHASSIASTVGPGYEISPIAFGHSQMNLTNNDVERILKAFQINSPWSAMGSLANRVGSGAPVLRQSFDNISQRRHAAAHRVNAIVETTDLQSSVIEIIGIALAFDLLASSALRKILDADPAYLRGKELAANDVRIRFLTFEKRPYWREIVEGATRAIARNLDVGELKPSCLLHARVANQAVVVKDERGLPSQWYTPAID